MLFPKPFQLTVQQKESGHITAVEMREFSGGAYTVVYLDEFPGWDYLRQGKPLPPHVLQTRKQALRGHLKDYYAHQSSGKADKTLESISERRVSSICTVFSDSFPIPSFPDKDAYSFAHELGQAAHGVLTPLEVCYEEDSWTKRRFAPISPSRKKAGHLGEFFLLTSLQKQDAELFSHVILNQSIDGLWYLPDLKTFSLLSELHEFAHSLQPDTDYFPWLQENHADLFALCSVRESPEYNEIIKDWLHVRYLELLHPAKAFSGNSLASHAIAPALDDLLVFQKPPEENEIFNSLLEIFSYLGEALSDHADKSVIKEAWLHLSTQGNTNSSKARKARKEILASFDFYSRSFLRTYFHQGPIFWTHLERLCEKRCFVMPLAQKIAERIVNASLLLTPMACRAQISYTRDQFLSADIPTIIVLDKQSEYLAREFLSIFRKISQRTLSEQLAPYEPKMPQAMTVRNRVNRLAPG